MKKELVYSIFLECSKYTEDSFWKCVFEDLAYGKSPYGSYISKGFIYSIYKGKEFSYKIDSFKDPESIFNELYFIFTKKLGIYSLEDRSRNKINLEDSNIRNMDWNSIKKKNIKDFVIESYVIDMMKSFTLTIQQSKKLLSIINIAFIFKKLTNEDITFSNGKILKIKGISFKPKQVDYNINIYNCI